MVKLVPTKPKIDYLYEGYHPSTLGTGLFTLYEYDIIEIDNNLGFRSIMESRVFLSYADLSFITSIYKFMINEVEIILMNQTALSHLTSAMTASKE